MRLKGNNKPKSLSRSFVQEVFFKLCQEIYMKNYICCLLASILSWKWHYLKWPDKGPKFNLHHLREKCVIFKMVALTAKSGLVFLVKSLKIWGFDNLCHINLRVTKFWSYDQIYNIISSTIKFGWWCHGEKLWRHNLCFKLSLF